ncbi:uncharacterized protein [Amphiura filiformis]|uniref:uncharacterized protein isoform X3 n=1 Tax=Amphiura filiformis TaxID=82378 RepID=UPI003B22120F
MNDQQKLLPEEREFQEAARSGNVKLVKTFIRNRINVNCMDEKDRTSLHLAAGQGHTEVIETLVDSDVRIDFADKYGMNGILWAAWFGQKAAIESLVKCGANVKAENKLGQTMVHCAASRGHVDVLQYIVTDILEEDEDDEEDNDPPEELDADLPNMEDQTKTTESAGAFGTMWGGIGNVLGYVSNKLQGVKQQKKIRDEKSYLEQKLPEKLDSKTPLLIACEAGQLAALEFLINARCNKLARTANGSTGLHLAAAKGHPEILAKLLECDMEIDVRNSEGKTPLHMAAENGHGDVVELLLQRKTNGNIKSSRNFGAIHFAAKNNHTNVIRILAKYRVDFNLRCEFQNAAIHIASALGNCEAIDAILDGGGNVNAMNEKKRTALHEAVENGFTDAVEKLLIGGIYVPQIDKSGKTALMMAARAENITCVDMIIKADRFFIKRKQFGQAYKRGSEPIQFRKERNAAQCQMRPVCWDLATKHLTQEDMEKLIFVWSFTQPQVKAIQSQFTGKKSWKEHTYRMMLIWLHGIDDNPLKELYESLVSIGRKKLAEQVRFKVSQQGNGKGCSIS